METSWKVEELKFPLRIGNWGMQLAPKTWRISTKREFYSVFFSRILKRGITTHLFNLSQISSPKTPPASWATSTEQEKWLWSWSTFSLLLLPVKTTKKRQNSCQHQTIQGSKTQQANKGVIKPKLPVWKLGTQDNIVRPGFVPVPVTWRCLSSDSVKRNRQSTRHDVCKCKTAQEISISPLVVSFGRFSFVVTPPEKAQSTSQSSNCWKILFYLI